MYKPMKRRFVVDLDQLLEKRTKLVREIQNINSLVDLIGDGGAVEEAPSPEPSPAQQLSLKPLGKKRSFSQGARRVLILHLFTGPATELELVRALAWARHKVHSALHTCQRDGLVMEQQDKPNFFCLTMKGKLAAEFFQRNPSRVRYELTEWTK